MANNNQQNKASSAERLITSLPELIALLRQNGFDVGTEQYLAATDLILALTFRDGLVPPKELRPGLSGLFSSRREQQEAFPGFFDPWYRMLGLEELEKPTEGEVSIPVVPTLNDRLRMSLQRYRWYALVITLSIAISVTWWQWEPVVTEDPQASISVSPEKKLDQVDKSLPDLIPPPKTPAEPVIPPANYWPAWTDWARLLWIVPFVIWCFWFLSRVFLCHVVLKKRKQRPGEAIILKHLEVASDQETLFSSPKLAETWRYLRRYRAQSMRRLNEAASVLRTIERGGYFTPVYRERQVPPAYIVLNDRRHAQDHTASMMQELVSTMREENLQVTLFNYHADPDYAIREGDVGMERNPSELAAVYSDHDLLMAGDGDALFDSTGISIKHKLAAFAPFRRRVLLTQNPVWYQQHRNLAYDEADFERYPLTPQGITQFAVDEGKSGWDSPFDLAIPQLLTVDPKGWVEEKRLQKKLLYKLLEQLENYLGRQGMLLLCATAGYPELNWNLTRALDIQLGLDESGRPLRLRKLSRLPWYRYGKIPNYLRLALLRHIESTAFEDINQAFRALLENAGDKPLKLPYAVPEWQGLWAYWRERIRLSPPHHPLADRVFASVVRGRRPGLIEFALPQMRQGGLGGGWQGLVLPLIGGLVLLPLAVWLNLWIWQAWLEPKARLTALADMQKAHRKTPVVIEAPMTLNRHRNALYSSLTNWGFGKFSSALPDDSHDIKQRKTTSSSVDSQTITTSDLTSSPRNQVHYWPKDKATAIIIAQRLSYLYYGEEPELIEIKQGRAIDGDSIEVVLTVAPRVFRDVLTSMIEPIEPEMVLIKGGEFTMGSDPEKDSGAYAVEHPQHYVKIKPFYLGKYEVTIAEYMAFANATGRVLLPGDEDWGRDRRPVINVGWEDAVAYAEWLSQQTGKRYRLPTEAEWEYAARAGSTTKYSWGDEINQDGKVWANCDGCGSQWDGNQTAPVGSFDTNAFGLHDMAGNVWEWTQDCWHSDYKNARSDGSAWLQSGQGDCGRRVIRGGSWDSIPRLLRSAFRNRYHPDVRSNDLGFRLAQDP